ncbi:MAG: hypothetical protein BIFFINMI_02162 [Phycisphaerae bacterium]|nr:hypothetical protein [Phycisphaerae bacterium]
MNGQIGGGFGGVILGSHYWRAPTPPEAEWEGDLARAADMGIEAIQLRVQWAWHERVEGRLDFAEVVRLMDLAHARGLRTVVKFMLPDAPHWLFARYDADRVGPDGRVIPATALSALYSGIGPPCFDRPLVRDKADGFIRGLARATCDHPSLAFYSLWNEIRSTPYGQCACPDSRRAFESWLRARYGTVAAMNAALGKDFGEFAEFRPPSSTNDFTSALVWRTWAAEQLVDTLRWVRSRVREVAPDVPVVVHAGMNNMVNAAMGDSTCDRLNAEVVDLFGHSGVFWAGTFHGYERIEGRATRDEPTWRTRQYILSMQDNWVRNVAAGRPTMNYEVYGNDYGARREDFGPAEMNDFLLTSLSEGVKVMMFWQFKAERIGLEAENCGLAELDGTIPPRGEQVRRLAAFIREHRDLLADYRPETGRVALLYDQASDMISQLMEHGESGQTGSTEYRYKNNLKGWYRLLWEANIPVEIVPTESAGDLSRYEAVVAPALLRVSDALRPALLDYVAHGGRLIADAGFDSRADNAWARVHVPGREFAELLGLASGRKQLHPAPVEVLRSPYGPLPAGDWFARLLPGDGPWASRQAARAVLFAFNPGSARYLNPAADFAPFYAWWDRWTGIRPRWPGLRVRVGSSGGRPVCFAHNLSDGPLPLPAKGAADLLAARTDIPPDEWVVLAGQ